MSWLFLELEDFKIRYICFENHVALLPGISEWEYIACVVYPFSVALLHEKRLIYKNETHLFSWENMDV